MYVHPTKNVEFVAISFTGRSGVKTKVFWGITFEEAQSKMDDWQASKNVIILDELSGICQYQNLAIQVCYLT